MEGLLDANLYFLEQAERLIGLLDDAESTLVCGLRSGLAALLFGQEFLVWLVCHFTIDWIDTCWK